MAESYNVRLINTGTLSACLHDVRNAALVSWRWRHQRHVRGIAAIKLAGQLLYYHRYAFNARNDGVWIRRLLDICGSNFGCLARLTHRVSAADI